MSSFFDEIARNRIKSIILMLLFIGLFSLIIYVFVLFMADANGARLTRDPKGLSSALKKIKLYSESTQSKKVRTANEMTASLYFSNPFSKNSIANILSTHPPIDERIKRLDQMY